MTTFIQVPPDGAGKLVETLTPLSSAHRQVFTLGDGFSSGIAPVTTSGGLLMSVPPAMVDVNNSSTVELGVGGVFTGAATEILGFQSICVSIFSNAASAANGLKLEFSQDGTNWDHITQLSIPAGNEITTILSNRLRYFRVVYTNGASTQSSFRLQTVLEMGMASGTVREMSVGPTAGDLAQLTRAVISGTTGGSVFTDVKVSPSGTLQVGGTVDLSSGVVTLSSTPLVVVASSSPLPPTSLTSGTVTLSSNPTVVSASSGLVQALISSGNASSIFHYASSSSGGPYSTSIATVGSVLRGYSLFNVATAPRYVKYFNTSSTPTIGVAVPLITILLPASTGGLGGGAVQTFVNGCNFPNGLAVAVTLNMADTDTGPAEKGDVVVNTYYT